MVRVVASLALLALISAPSARSGPALDLHLRLPQDPLLALAFRSDQPEIEAASLLALAERLAIDVDFGLRELQELLGSELLGALGPQFAASVDLPPLEPALMQLERGGVTLPDVLLTRSGLLAEVRQREAVLPALERVARRAGWTYEGDGESATVAIGGTSGPRLHVRVRGDRIAAAFSEDWIERALARRRASPRLGEGRDFAEIFGQLAQRPDELLYINLPALRRWIVESPLALSVLRATDESGQLFATVVDEHAMAMGLGSTSVRNRGGVQTSSYGPDWMAGPLRSGGMLAAITLPRMATRVANVRTHRSIDDLRRISSACDEFFADSDGYPGPTEGWVPVDRIAVFLEPVYVGELPRADAWSNPILYWSDGESYRVVSTGGDGVIDRDWRQSDEPLTSSVANGDIVFGDGRLLVVPAQLVSE